MGRLARTACLLGIVALECSARGQALATDWPQFRGVDGSGVAQDAAATPIAWGDDRNLRWSVALPGRGVSSPIVVGDQVVVTSWSGSGAGDLLRHLTSYDRRTGTQLWSVDIPPAAADEPYDGMLAQTGYAAHTPVGDGQRIYCFFGVSGVYAFDLQGRQLWRRSVGTGFDPRHWGTAASPVVVDDLLVVNAAAESHALVALRTATGDEAWRFEDPALQSTWSTPALVRRAEGGAELLLAVPGQAWGFDPAAGRRLWSCGGTDPNSACASLIAEHGVAYAVVGRRGGSALAIRTGGQGDVAKSHVVWSKNIAGSVGTPVVHGGLIYSFAGGMAECIDAATGESLARKRLGGAAAVADPAVQPTAAVASPEDRAFSAAEPSRADAPEQVDRRAAPEPEPSRDASSGAGPAADRGRNFEDGGRGGRGGERGFGRGGRGGRSQDYASPVVADGKVYFVRRSGEAFVFAVGPALEQLAVNRFSGDADFSATPAIADGEIYLRSSEKLYCVAHDSR